MQELIKAVITAFLEVFIERLEKLEIQERISNAPQDEVTQAASPRGGSS
ncbi:hypothetical protein [Pseudovibrio axinellae]|nr:hypothetical protein [Pseudovibrio axinellae]